MKSIKVMEKKDKKQRDIVLSQDNALTTARYKFDLIEKRALYSIIRNIRAQYIENENGRRDLFDDLIITIHEEELKKCGDNTKMQNIYDALKRLRNRDIEINNEKMWLSIGFVNYVKHIKNKSYFEVQVSKEVLPYYVELAQNFTSYSMTVAIALKSTFSQRFYELCCQYRNAGFFFYTVEKLREMFMLEKKYKRGCDFKRRVLDDPQKELRELYNAGQCDLYFEFEPKSYKGKEVTEYKFYVYTRQTEQQKLLEYESANQNEVYMLLTGNGRTFLHLCIGGVRHDTGKINNRFICLFKQRFYFIIDAILFDGAAAVGKQHCLAFLSKLCAESLRRAPLTKIHLRRIRKSETVHVILFLQS